MIDAKVQSVLLKKFNIVYCSEDKPDFIFNYGIQIANGTQLGAAIVRFPDDLSIGASMDLTRQPPLHIDQTISSLFFRVIEVDLDLGDRGIGSNILVGWDISTFQAREDDAPSQRNLSLGPNEKAFLQEVTFRVATGELGPLSGSEFNVDIVFEVHYSRVEFGSFGVVDGDVQVFLSGDLTEPAARIVLDRLQPDLIVENGPGQRRLLKYILTPAKLGIDFRDIALLKHLLRTGIAICNGVPTVANGQLVTSISAGPVRKELVLKTISALSPTSSENLTWFNHSVDSIAFNAAFPLSGQTAPQSWKGKIAAIILERFEPRRL